MKPFNIEEYLKNPNREIVTRDGRNVRIICTNFDSEKYPIIGEIKGYGQPAIYDEGGCAPCSDYDNSTDLFFVPETREGWINIYKGRGGLITNPYVFSSREDAEESSRHCCGYTEGMYLATAKVEWEE